MNTFDNHSHLDAESISRYAEAMYSGNMETLAAPLVSHVENCAQCHGEVVELFTILNKLEPDANAPKAKSKAAKVFSLNPVLRLALVASVAALAIFTYFQLSPATQNKGTSEIATDTTSSTKIGEPQLVEKNKPVQEVTTPSASNPKENDIKNFPSQPSPEQLFAANFIPADDFEALIGTTFRSNNINVLSPEPGRHFQKEELITFSWDLKNSEFLYITILNNREEIVFRQEISVAKYETAKISTPGLYYWKLENEEELLYVGKFHIDH